MTRVIGIDLGTTNTAVAVLDGGRPRVLEDERGYKVLPSVVSAKGDGRFVVGQAAHNLIITNPDKTVYATKRLIGRRFDSPEVQRVMSRVQFKLRPAADGGVQMQVGDQWMTPTEVAAVILQVAKGIAERALGEKVEEAVVTVPAYFNHAQRKATLEAAQLAGLQCERLLNEPTAAALAYGHRKNIERTVVVFDLGGGTFDVSVLKLSDGIYEILATTGDTFLGGEDFDYRIVDYLADLFQARTRIDVRQDRSALQRVKDAAERAKCELSFSDRAEIVIPHLVPGEGLDSLLTRSKLEELTGELIDRCLEIARRAVADAGLSLSDIEEVVLVGGQTRMPKVRDAVAGLFGREPNRSVHPEEVVAIGAAVHAANLGEPDANRTVLLDVTPFDLGIDTAGGMFVPLVARNARVPASEAKVFATVSDNQETVRITVRQGDSRTAAQNEFLGEFVLEGLTPAPRLRTKVDVTFRIDTNGMLHVSAVERGTGEKKQITIRNYAEHARSPAFPDAEQAKADDLMRRLRGSQESEAAAPAKKRKKAAPKGDGLLGKLFGKPAKKTANSEKPGKAAPAAPPAAEVTGTPVEVDAAGAGPIPSIEPPPVPTAAEIGMARFRDDPASVIETFSGASEPGEEDYEELGEAALDEYEGELVEDGLVLDPYVEPLPDESLLDAAGLDGDLMADLGLSPIEEDAYADEGAFASLGVAGGVGAGSADDLFGAAGVHDLSEGEPLEAGGDLDMEGLFAGEDLGDVEVMDPFAPLNTEIEPAPADPFEGLALGPPSEADETVDEPMSEADPSTEAAPPISEAVLLDELLVESIAGEVGPADEATGPAFDDPFATIAPVESPRSFGEPFPGATPTPVPDEEPPLDPFTGHEQRAQDDPFALEQAVTAFDEAPVLSGRAVAPIERTQFGESAIDELPLEELLLEDDAAPEGGLAGIAIGVLPDPISDASTTNPELFRGGADPFGLEPPPTPVAAEDEPLAELGPTGFALLDPNTDARTALAEAARGPVSSGGWDGRAVVALSAADRIPGDNSLSDFASDARTRPGVQTPLPPEPEPEPVRSARKPARVRLHYHDFEVLVAEYRENLRRGGTFIRTDRPLAVGRECLFEVAAPGLDEPLVFPATVTFVATAAPGQDAGMGVEYRLADRDRQKIERVLSRA